MGKDIPFYINIFKHQFIQQYGAPEAKASTIISTNFVAQSEVAKLRPIANNDTVKVVIKTYLLSNILEQIQQNLSNTTLTYTDLLGDVVEGKAD
eukprot:UN06503